MAEDLHYGQCDEEELNWQHDIKGLVNSMEELEEIQLGNWLTIFPEPPSQRKANTEHLMNEITNEHGSK